MTLNVIILSSLTAAAISVLSPQGAHSQTMTIQLEFNDELIVIEQEPSASSAGVSRYLGSYDDPDGHWSAWWDYWVDPDPLTVASFEGSSSLVNHSGAIAHCGITTTVPLCPVITGESRIGALLIVTLFTDEHGGAMWSCDNKPIWSVMADGVAVRNIFDAPFYLSSTGQGIASLTAQFGSPFPSESSGSFNETLGVRRSFVTTTGEMVTISTGLFLSTDLHSSEDCYLLGDLNQDGVVDGADLLIMLQEWGQCPDPSDCPADLNNDHVVDSVDLLLLLSSWTGPMQ